VVDLEILDRIVNGVAAFLVDVKPCIDQMDAWHRQRQVVALLCVIEGYVSKVLAPPSAFNEATSDDLILLARHSSQSRAFVKAIVSPKPADFLPKTFLALIFAGDDGQADLIGRRPGKLKNSGRIRSLPKPNAKRQSRFHCVL
jgi:hypothetical protein